MICLKCQKEFEAVRATAKFCSDACKVAYHRKGVIVTPVTVKSEDVTLSPEADVTVRKYDNVTVITPEMEKKLDEIFKQYEKDNKGFKCLPCMVRGKRILTEWEKMKLRQYDEVHGTS